MTDPSRYDAHTLATAGEAASDDGVRWLAMVLRQACLMIAAAVERRYGIERRHQASTDMLQSR